MPAIGIFVLTLLGGESFGQKLDQKIIGTWVGDEEATRKYWKENGIDSDESMLKRASATSISFGKDKALVVKVVVNDMPEFEAKGEYKVLSADENKKELKLRFTPSDNQGPDETEVLIKILEIKMKTFVAITPDNDPPLVFAKAKTSRKPDKKEK